MHIRGVGEWTNSLYNYFERADKEAVLSDELAKDLELVPSLKSDESDQVSMAVNCSSMRSVTPSCAGDLSLTPTYQNVFQDSTLQFTTPNSANDTVIEVKNFPCAAYKNALMDRTYTKQAPDSLVDSTEVARDETVVEIEKEKKLSVTSKDSTGSSLSSRSFSLYLPHRRTSFSSTSASRVIQLKNKEDLKVMLAEQCKNSLRVDDMVGGHRTLQRRSAKEKRRSVRVSVAKKGLRRCQTVIVMPTVVEDEEDNDFKSDLMNAVLKNEEEMKDLKREAEVENVVLTQKPLKVSILFS